MNNIKTILSKGNFTPTRLLGIRMSGMAVYDELLYSIHFKMLFR